MTFNWNGRLDRNSIRPFDPEDEKDASARPDFIKIIPLLFELCTICQHYIAQPTLLEDKSDVRVIPS